MDIKNIIKLAKMINKFAEVETSNGILICDGDLAVGVDVFVESEGEIIAAPDGQYETEDAIVVVLEGKVSEINPKEEAPAEEAPAEEAPAEVEQEEVADPVEEAPAEEEKDEKDAKIAELEAKIAELEAENAELKACLGKAEEELSKPVATEAKFEKQKSTLKNYLNKN